MDHSMIDRLLLATERGSRIARIIKRIVEDMFIPKGLTK
jgi:hypothetical protein